MVEKDVNFVLNGNDHIVKTNEFGVAKLSLNLAPGSYAIEVVHPNGQSITRNATIVSRITGNKDVKVDYSFSSTYKVRVYGDNGNAVGAGEAVSIKIGSTTYNAITNKNGYASVKVANLLPGTYSITAEYKGVKVSNKVVVKQVLKAKNKKFKRYKAKKYSVTLKTSVGT